MLILQNNKPGKFILRQAALLVLVHFFFSTMAMGHTGFFEPIHVPSGLGSIQFNQPPQPSSANTPLIVHIQDVHALPEAQGKIEKIIGLLQRKYGFSLLLLEGAQTRLDPKLFHFFNDPWKNLKMADCLVENGELSGPERFLIREESADYKGMRVTAEGIEDENLYRDNLAAFKKVLASREESDWFLQKMESRIEKLSARIWPSHLRRLAQTWKAFHRGDTDFLDFLKILRRTAKNELNLDLQDPAFQLNYPHLVRIFTLDAMSPALDAEKFSEEKKEILRYFRGAHLKTELILDFDRRVRTGRSVRRRGGDLRGLFEEIYRELPGDFNFKKYPQIALWGGTLVLREELRSGDIAAEAEEVTEKIFNREIQNAEREKLFALWKDIVTLRRLFSLELVRKEYRDLLNRKESVGPVGVLKRIKQMEEGTRKFDFPEDDLKDAEVEKIFHQAIEFYRGAERREKKMGENIFRAMKAAGTAKAIVVTGGFHAEGLQKAIEMGGGAYVQISPALEKDMNHRPNYLRSILGGDAGENHLKNPAYLVPRQAQMNLGADLAARDAWIDRAYRTASLRRKPPALFSKSKNPFRPEFALAASLGSEPTPSLTDTAMHVLPDPDQRRIAAANKFIELVLRLGSMTATGLEQLSGHKDWVVFDNISGEKVWDFFTELRDKQADLSSFNGDWEEDALRFLGREHEGFRDVKLTPQLAFRIGYEAYLRRIPMKNDSPYASVKKFTDYLFNSEIGSEVRFQRASLLLQEWGMIDFVAWTTGALDRVALYAERKDGSQESEIARQFLGFFVSQLFESAAMTHAFMFNRSVIEGFLARNHARQKNVGVVYLLSGSTHLYNQAVEIAKASGADISRLHALYVNRRILEGDQDILREYLVAQGIPKYDTLVIVDTGFHGTAVKGITNVLAGGTSFPRAVYGRLLSMSEPPSGAGFSQITGFNHFLEAVHYLPDDKHRAALNLITHFLDTAFPAPYRSPVRLARDSQGGIIPVLEPVDVPEFARIAAEAIREGTQRLMAQGYSYPALTHPVWEQWLPDDAAQNIKAGGTLPGVLTAESLGLELKREDHRWHRSKFLAPHPEIGLEDIARAGALLRQSRAAAGETGLSDIAQGIFPAPLIHSDRLDGMMHDLTRLEKKYYLLYLPYLPEGSFKPYVTADVLDHFDRLFRTDPARLKQIRRIVAESTGNQGKAVAAAVNKLKALYPEHAKQLQAVIFVPFAANSEKVLAMQDLGAAVVRHKFTDEELEEYLKASRPVRAEMELRAENEGRILKDYTEASARVDEDLAAHPQAVYYIRHGSRMGIAGYANIGFEALDQWFRYVAPELGLGRHIVSSADLTGFETLVRTQRVFRRVAISGPAGSGGLESGLVQVKQLNPLIRVFGTQVPGVDPLFVSLTQDEMVNKADFVFDQEAVRHVDGIAATPERLTFEILRQMLDGLTRVPYQDNDLMTRLVWGLNLKYPNREGHRLLEIEPASVLPLTNMIYHGSLLKAEHIIIPVTGRVTDRDLKQEILSVPYRDAYQIIKSHGRDASLGQLDQAAGGGPIRQPLAGSLGQEPFLLPITLTFRVRHWAERGASLLEDSRHLPPSTVRQVQRTFSDAVENNEFDRVYFNLLKAWLFISHNKESSFFSEIKDLDHDELRQRYEDFEREVQQLLIDVLIYRDGRMAAFREGSGHLKPIDGPSKVLAVLSARRLGKSELIQPLGVNALDSLMGDLAPFPSALTYGEILPGILSREFEGIRLGFEELFKSIIPHFKDTDKLAESTSAREERHSLILNHTLLIDQNLYLFARDLAGPHDYALSASIVDNALAAAIRQVSSHPQLTGLTNHFSRYRAYFHPHMVYRNVSFAQEAAFAFLGQLSRDLAGDIREIRIAEVEGTLEPALIGPEGSLTRAVEAVKDMRERVRPKTEGLRASSLGTEVPADERVVKLEQLLEKDRDIRKKAWTLVSQARQLNRKLQSRVLSSAITAWVADLQQSGRLSEMALNDFSQAVKITRGWGFLKAKQSGKLRGFRDMAEEIRRDKLQFADLLADIERISNAQPVLVSFEGLPSKERRRLIALHALEIAAGVEAVEDDLPRAFVNLYRRLEGFSADLRVWLKKPEKFDREKTMRIVAALKSIAEGSRTDPDHGLIASSIRERFASLAAKLNALTEETASVLAKKQSPRVSPPEALQPQVSSDAVTAPPEEVKAHPEAGYVQLEFDFGPDKQPEGQSLGSAKSQNVLEEMRVAEDVTRRIARIYPAPQREAELIRLGILVRASDSAPVQTMPAFARAYFTPSEDFGVAVSSANSLESVALLEELMVSQANKMLIVYVRGPVDKSRITAKRDEYDKKFQGRILLVPGNESEGRSYEDFVEGLVRGGKFADSVRRAANQWYRKSGRMGQSKRRPLAAKSSSPAPSSAGDLTKNHSEFLKFLTVVAGEEDFSRLALPFVTPFYSKDLGLDPGTRDFAETFYAVIGSGISEAARLKRQVGDELDLRLSRDGLKVEGLSLNENSLNHYLELMTAIQSARSVLARAA